jgi:hypothetical protein
MSDRARRLRRFPLTILLGAVFAAALLVPWDRARAANDPLDALAGPPSSRFT